MAVVVSHSVGLMFCQDLPRSAPYTAVKNMTVVQ